jgi:hypothetical protein
MLGQKLFQQPQFTEDVLAVSLEPGKTLGKLLGWASVEEAPLVFHLTGLPI